MDNDTTWAFMWELNELPIFHNSEGVVTVRYIRKKIQLNCDSVPPHHLNSF